MSEFSVTLMNDKNVASEVLRVSSILDEQTLVGIIRNGVHANMFLHLCEDSRTFYPLESTPPDIDFVALTMPNSKRSKKFRDGHTYILAWNDSSGHTPWRGTRYAICLNQKQVAISFTTTSSKTKYSSHFDTIPVVSIE